MQPSGLSLEGTAISLCTVSFMHVGNWRIVGRVRRRNCLVQLPALIVSLVVGSGAFADMA